MQRIKHFLLTFALMFFCIGALTSAASAVSPSMEINDQTLTITGITFDSASNSATTFIDSLKIKDSTGVITSATAFTTVKFIDCSSLNYVRFLATAFNDYNLIFDNCNLNGVTTSWNLGDSGHTVLFKGGTAPWASLTLTGKVTLDGVNMHTSQAYTFNLYGGATVKNISAPASITCNFRGSDNTLDTVTTRSANTINIADCSNLTITNCTNLNSNGTSLVTSSSHFENNIFHSGSFNFKGVDNTFSDNSIKTNFNLQDGSSDIKISNSVFPQNVNSYVANSTFTDCVFESTSQFYGSQNTFNGCTFKGRIYFGSSSNKAQECKTYDCIFQSTIYSYSSSNKNYRATFNPHNVYNTGYLSTWHDSTISQKQDSWGLTNLQFYGTTHFTAFKSMSLTATYFNGPIEVREWPVDITSVSISSSGSYQNRITGFEIPGNVNLSINVNQGRFSGITTHASDDKTASISISPGGFISDIDFGDAAYSLIMPNQNVTVMNIATTYRGPKGGLSGDCTRQNYYWNNVHLENCVIPGEYKQGEFLHLKRVTNCIIRGNIWQQTVLFSDLQTGNVITGNSSSAPFIVGVNDLLSKTSTSNTINNNVETDRKIRINPTTKTLEVNNLTFSASPGSGYTTLGGGSSGWGFYYLWRSVFAQERDYNTTRSVEWMTNSEYITGYYDARKPSLITDTATRTCSGCGATRSYQTNPHFPTVEGARPSKSNYWCSPELSSFGFNADTTKDIFNIKGTSNGISIGIFTTSARRWNKSISYTTYTPSYSLSATPMYCSSCGRYMGEVPTYSDTTSTNTGNATVEYMSSSVGQAVSSVDIEKCLITNCVVNSWGIDVKEVTFDGCTFSTNTAIYGSGKMIINNCHERTETYSGYTPPETRGLRFYQNYSNLSPRFKDQPLYFDIATFLTDPNREGYFTPLSSISRTPRINFSFGAIDRNVYLTNLENMPTRRTHSMPKLELSEGTLHFMPAGNTDGYDLNLDKYAGNGFSQVAFGNLRFPDLKHLTFKSPSITVGKAGLIYFDYPGVVLDIADKTFDVISADVMQLYIADDGVLNYTTERSNSTCYMKYRTIGLGDNAEINTGGYAYLQSYDSSWASSNISGRSPTNSFTLNFGGAPSTISKIGCTQASVTINNTRSISRGSMGSSASIIKNIDVKNLNISVSGKDSWLYWENGTVRSGTNLVMEDNGQLQTKGTLNLNGPSTLTLNDGRLNLENTTLVSPQLSMSMKYGELKYTLPQITADAWVMDGTTVAGTATLLLKGASASTSDLNFSNVTWDTGNFTCTENFNSIQMKAVRAPQTALVMNSNVARNKTIDLTNCNFGPLSGTTSSSIIIDRGSYRGNPAINMRSATVIRGQLTDTNGTSTPSKFTLGEDSVETVSTTGNLIVRTIKLENPPIEIDWGTFPGLDLDLFRPLALITALHRNIAIYIFQPFMEEQL